MNKTLLLSIPKNIYGAVILAQTLKRAPLDLEVKANLFRPKQITCISREESQLQYQETNLMDNILNNVFSNIETKNKIYLSDVKSTLPFFFQYENLYQNSSPNIDNKKIPYFFRQEVKNNIINLNVAKSDNEGNLQRNLQGNIIEVSNFNESLLQIYGLYNNSIYLTCNLSSNSQILDTTNIRLEKTRTLLWIFCKIYICGVNQFFNCPIKNNLQTTINIDRNIINTALHVGYPLWSNNDIKEMLQNKLLRDYL